MNRTTHLFTFCFLSLLVLFISGASAQSTACTKSPNCDCEPENIQGCNSTNFNVGGLACGSEFNCTLANDIYQLSSDGLFCHLGPCIKNCTINVPDSACNK